uniref:Stomatin (EPB72)-like 2 n=1 Tax=Amphilophus citrinellus TaxID=61819 RepID=A0A3Q0SAK5_AMPCI
MCFPSLCRPHPPKLPINTVLLFLMGRFHQILEPVILLFTKHGSSSQLLHHLHQITHICVASVLTGTELPHSHTGPFFKLSASYGVGDPEYAVTQLAQTTVCSELVKITLDEVFRGRNGESLNRNINQASDEWAIRCIHYEIKDMEVPPRVNESMQMQVEAECRKSSTVLECEGTREVAISVTEGHRHSQIFFFSTFDLNNCLAGSEVQAMLARAEAKSKAIRLLPEALADAAEQYESAFSNLAKESNTENNNGPRIEPCGTPQVKEAVQEENVPATVNVLSDK